MTGAAPETRHGVPQWLVRAVPITGWLTHYKISWLSRDAVAGFTIWGLLIPEMIAYASLAGLPPQAGLYTLLASLALYACFGTSRHLVVAGDLGLGRPHLLGGHRSPAARVPANMPPWPPGWS